MFKTHVFQDDNSQFIRIPQEISTDEKDFCINKIGDIYIAYPASDPWAPTRQVIGTFPEDFMEDREQPSLDGVSTREEL